VFFIPLLIPSERGSGILNQDQQMASRHSNITHLEHTFPLASNLASNPAIHMPVSMWSFRDHICVVAWCMKSRIGRVLEYNELPHRN
jgi:hypothetical protein